MSKKFVRNITGSKLRGDKVEPLHTNVQNDLLSDEEDVFVRNKKEYHALTDNLKTEEFKAGSFLGIRDKSKNGLTIIGNGTSKEVAELGSDVDSIMNPLNVHQAINKLTPDLVKEHETPTEIISKNNKLKVEKTTKNNFELDLEDNNISNYFGRNYLVSDTEKKMDVTLKNEYTLYDSLGFIIKYQTGLTETVFEELNISFDMNNERAKSSVIFTLQNDLNEAITINFVSRQSKYNFTLTLIKDEIKAVHVFVDGHKGIFFNLTNFG